MSKGKLEDTGRRYIADLERANYAATYEATKVTPGLELTLRDDVIMTASELLPIPDANHACLLRSSTAEVGDLIDEVVDYYQTREAVPTVYVSPACEPEGLAEHLVERGFVEQPGREAWMTLDSLSDLAVPSPTPRTQVRQITQDEVETFTEVFLTAFGMPLDFAPAMVRLLKPSIGLEHTYHYIAYSDDRPVGTCSLLVHETYGVLGSEGVIRSRRSRGAAMNLVIAVVKEARKHGVETLMLQTAAGTLLERLLRIGGFRRVFTRTCYTLDYESSH
ncbi:MAG: GNAT family N-acetyltransferase [Anaerolineae bacterium]